MRFTAWRGSRGTPSTPPRSAPLFSGCLCPHPFHWEPLVTSCGEGVVKGPRRPFPGLHLSPSGSIGGGGGVGLETCASRTTPPPTFSQKGLELGGATFLLSSKGAWTVTKRLTRNDASGRAGGRMRRGHREEHSDAGPATQEATVQPGGVRASGRAARSGKVTPGGPRLSAAVFCPHGRFLMALWVEEFCPG